MNETVISALYHGDKAFILVRKCYGSSSVSVCLSGSHMTGARPISNHDSLLILPRGFCTIVLYIRTGFNCMIAV